MESVKNVFGIVVVGWAAIFNGLKAIKRYWQQQKPLDKFLILVIVVCCCILGAQFRARYLQRQLQQAELLKYQAKLKSMTGGGRNGGNHSSGAGDDQTDEEAAQLYAARKRRQYHLPEESLDQTNGDQPKQHVIVADGTNSDDALYHDGSGTGGGGSDSSSSSGVDAKERRSVANNNDDNALSSYYSGNNNGGGGGSNSNWDYDPPTPAPTPKPPLTIEELQKEIEKVARAEKLETARMNLREVEEKRKMNQRVQREYDFGDEQEAFRDKEREWQREKWEELEKAHHRWRRHAKIKAIREDDEDDYQQQRRIGNGNDDGGSSGNGGGSSSMYWGSGGSTSYASGDHNSQGLHHRNHHLHGGRRSLIEPGMGGALSSKSSASSSSSSSSANDIVQQIQQCPGIYGDVKSFVPYKEHIASVAAQKEFAYVTYVSSTEFVPAAATLMYSIAQTGSRHARAILVTKDVLPKDREVLSLLAQLIEIDVIPAPKYVSNKRYRETFTKLRIWELAMFTKVLYVDTDVIIVRNMDDIFDLDEWSVPMDAEQHRYSTGMMLLQPSLTTFDSMMKHLKVTEVSMELPDLLFLKEYFDKVAPKKINIIPRWYQVYQEEFGAQYSTYLTARKEKITIFDSRIHGIHYPGENKPWREFSNRLAKYSSQFCFWDEAEEFKYAPHFLWYLNHERMKIALAREMQGTGGLFIYESGTAVTILSEYRAKKEKEIEEENKWRNSGYGGYNSYGGNNNNGYSNYNSGYGNSYNSYGNSYQQQSSSGGSYGTNGDSYKWEWRNNAWVKVPSSGSGSGTGSSYNSGGKNSWSGGGASSSTTGDSASIQSVDTSLVWNTSVDASRIPVFLSREEDALYKNLAPKKLRLEQQIKKRNKNKHHRDYYTMTHSFELEPEAKELVKSWGALSGHHTGKKFSQYGKLSKLENLVHHNQEKLGGDDGSSAKSVQKKPKSTDEDNEVGGAKSIFGVVSVKKKKQEESHDGDEDHVGSSAKSSEQHLKQKWSRKQLQEFDAAEEKGNSNEQQRSKEDQRGRLASSHDHEEEESAASATTGRRPLAVAADKDDDGSSSALLGGDDDGEAAATPAPPRQQRVHHQNAADGSDGEIEAATAAPMSQEKKRKKKPVKVQEDDDLDRAIQKRKKTVAAKEEDTSSPISLPPPTKIPVAKKSNNVHKLTSDDDEDVSTAAPPHHHAEEADEDEHAAHVVKPLAKAHHKKHLHAGEQVLVKPTAADGEDEDDASVADTAAPKKKKVSAADASNGGDAEGSSIDLPPPTKIPVGGKATVGEEADEDEHAAHVVKPLAKAHHKKHLHAGEQVLVKPTAADGEDEDASATATAAPKKKKLEKSTTVAADEEEPANSHKQKKLDSKKKKKKLEELLDVLHTPLPEPIGLIDFSNVPPFFFKMEQKWKGVVGDAYIWVVNFFTRSLIHPPTSSACGKPSYVSQYSDGVCRTNFDEGFSSHVLYDAKSTSTSSSVVGVVLRSKVLLDNPNRTKWMEVLIRCDKNMSPNTVEIDKASNGSTHVVIETVNPPNDRRYRMRLKSKCACADGCVGNATSFYQAAKTIKPAAKYLVRKAQREVNTTFSAWRAKLGVTHADRCLSFRNSVKKCLAAMPMCDYSPTLHRCVPPQEKWVMVAYSSDRQYSNCTHVGGTDQNLDLITLEKCQQMATSAGANVVNFGTPSTSTTKSPAASEASTSSYNKVPSSRGDAGAATTSSKKAAAVSPKGCYYKKCTKRSLLQGRIPLATWKENKEGFDVYMVNPYYGKNVVPAPPSTTAPVVTSVAPTSVAPSVASKKKVTTDAGGDESMPTFLIDDNGNVVDTTPSPTTAAKKSSEDSNDGAWPTAVDDEDSGKDVPTLVVKRKKQNNDDGGSERRNVWESSSGTATKKPNVWQKLYGDR